jgi:uncharacterized protein (UPF0332 family)
VTPEVARRLAKAERFLDQAGQQSPVDAPEATIHLAYYAMLHASAAVIQERLGKVPKTHGSIVRLFSREVGKASETGRAMGRALNRAESSRFVADYDDEAVPSVALAEAMRETAREFVAYCRSLL